MCFWVWGVIRFVVKKNLLAFNILTRLHIGGLHLTDDGLQHLAKMKKLIQLTISDGNITDSGLRHLERLKALGYLNITSRSRISATAKRCLQEKLPNLSLFQTQLKKNSPRKETLR